MEERRSHFTTRGLTIGETERPLYAGSFHYFRQDPKQWSPCLAEMAAMGFTAVDSPVPWSLHELRPGEFAWDKELELPRFVDLAHEHGLAVILRPGPFACPDLTDLGFPTRILKNHKLLARDPRGAPVWWPVPPKMCPLPSYASAAFQEEVVAWFEAFAEIITPQLAPAGPVAAIALDHHTGFYRQAAFACDYHPDALVWWREFAGDLEAPTDNSDRELAVKWVAFRDHSTMRALEWLHSTLDRVGLRGIARLHTQAPCHPRHLNLGEISIATGAAVSASFSGRGHDYPRLRETALYTTGHQAPAIATEITVGGNPWLVVRSASDDLRTLLTALSGGIRGFSLAMAVERDRWVGAPINADGTRTERGEDLARLLHTLREHGWHRLRRRAHVALVMSRADERFARASQHLPLPPFVAEMVDLGTHGSAALGSDPDAIRAREWWRSVTDALHLAQIPYDIVDESHGSGTLETYRAVLAPTLDRVDRRLWGRLRAAADANVRVVIGPGLPTVDELAQPLENPQPYPRIGRFRQGSIDDIAGLADDLLAAVGELESFFFADNQVDVDCSVHEDNDQTPRLLFVANRTGKKTRAQITVPSSCVLRDVMSGDVAPVNEQTASMKLSGWQVRCFRID